MTYSTGAVKVGKTRDPRRRIEQLRIGAAQYGATITDAWLSEPHGEYAANEARLHDACAAMGPRWAVETFACNIQDVVDAAGRLSMTKTPPAEPATRSNMEARAESRRQHVMRLIAEGYTYRMIAAELDVSVGTVHADVSRSSAS